jgi:argininosuccinate lyase
MKNTHYTNVIDVNRESFHFLGDAVYQARAALELMRAGIEGLEVESERAFQLVSMNFSTATELADLLVAEKDYSFRESHELVALVVRKAREHKMAATQITSAFIDQVALDEKETTLGLPEAKLRRALDPMENVRARSHSGGPAPDTVSQAIDQAQSRLERDRECVQETRARLEEAGRVLRDTARKMIGC